MVIREDNVYLSECRTGSIYHNWGSVQEAKDSGRFDFIWETEMEFESEKEFDEWWNSIDTWDNLLSLSDYFTEVK